MLKLGPIKNEKETENIFKQKGFKYSEYSGCVKAQNGEKTEGLCLYELTNEKITILYIEPTTDIPLADGILRSTLHIAAERSILNAFYGDKMSEDFLNKIGFIKSKAEKTLDIDKLFKSCCGCQ